jgi:hypothetical protein
MYLQRGQHSQPAERVMRHPRDIVVRQVYPSQASKVGKRLRRQLRDVILLQAAETKNQWEI